MNTPYLITAPIDGHDMTAEIENALAVYGTCRLSVGEFLTTGIHMPQGSSLFGEGGATKLILAPDVESGAAIRLSTYCTVKNMTLLGSGEQTRPEKLGERHGILFEGTAIDDNYDRACQPHNNTVSDCFIFGFSGGGITCHQTGYAVQSAMLVTNCHIRFSGAGINVSRFSEFHNFTNISASQNLYGCINNGGNNMFVNCGFSGNTVGFLIDNEHGQSPNCAHGSCVGCTFHHSDYNKGIGILIKNERPGFVFDGCQIGFSKIVLENSDCVVFNAMNILRNVEIHITGGTLTLFSGCAFHVPLNAFTCKDNGAVRFTNCFLKDGTLYDPTKDINA